MSPVPRLFERFLPTKREAKPSDPNALVLESWAQGYMVGSLIIMAAITLANMRTGRLLHKLILLELFLGIWQGFWVFFHDPLDGWWLSVSAIFLNSSWSLHNVIAWMKIKPFLSRPVSLIFIGTVILVQPYWVVEIYANFAYFHNVNDWFLKTRPWEALCRDPWWIFTTVALFWNIKNRYDMKFREILNLSPRFCVMLGAMVLSVIFIVLDICAVTHAFDSFLPRKGLSVGINPFWKFNFVFKCLTDSVVLDDFKTALDRLRAYKMSRLNSFSGDVSDRPALDSSLVRSWNESTDRDGDRRKSKPRMSGHDGDYANRTSLATLRVPSRTQHKDSFVSPLDDTLWKQSSRTHVDPEDIVPSAIEDPPLNQQDTPVTLEKKEEDWGEKASPLDDEHLTEEADYLHALREMHGGGSPTSPPRNVRFSLQSRTRSPPP